MGRFLDALAKRGLSPKIGPSGGLVLPKNCPPAIRATCLENKAEILREIALASIDWSDRDPGDPRPELEADHAAWDELLRLMDRQKSEIYGPVHFLRCMGAALVKSVSGWKIMRGQMDPAEYSEVIATLRTGDDVNSRATNPLTLMLRQL